MLMRTVLTEQAKGVSVRACTLAMGKVYTKTMLRYQNKYRSLLRTNPAFVKKVLAELAAEGIPAFDPYAAEAGRHGARGRRTESLATEAFKAISWVRDEDAQAFFRALSALAASASGAETDAFRRKCGGISERLSEQEHALARAREVSGSLCAVPADDGSQPALLAKRTQQIARAWRRVRRPLRASVEDATHPQHDSIATSEK